MTTPTVRTTIALPADLLRAADQAVAHGMARSRNELFAMALRHVLAERQHAAIDAEFVGMDGDIAYRAESAVLEAGLDRSSWETLRQAEIGNE